jgi:pSer/pThr/pTyr-binding forkhead associated (FHA) protein
MPASAGEKLELPPQALAPPPTQAHPNAVEPLPAGAALLVVKRGPTAGSRFVLDQPVITVGRQQDNDLVLDDVTVSRRHAEFHRRDQGFLVRDVGSLNGTYVNHEPVAEASLVSGDEVQIGKFLLLYLTDSPCDGTRR